MIQEWVSAEFAQLEPQRYLVKEVSIHLRKHASLIFNSFFFFLFYKDKDSTRKYVIIRNEYEIHENVLDNFFSNSSFTAIHITRDKIF